MVASQAAERRAVLIAEGDPRRPEFDRVLMEEEFALIKPPVDDPRWLPAALEHLDGYVLFCSDKRLAGTEDAFRSVPYRGHHVRAVPGREDRFAR